VSRVIRLRKRKRPEGQCLACFRAGLTLNQSAKVCSDCVKP
jgi:hypothetical protein